MEFTGIFIPVKYLDADDLTLREKAFLGYSVSRITFRSPRLRNGY
nr:MAG TPA: hypothetical protein [Caudoviricetes sp.]